MALTTTSTQLPSEIAFHELNPAVMGPAVAPTRSRPIENYPQQIFRQTYGLNHHAESAANKIFFHEINPAVMIPELTPPHSRPIESYSHETFRQSYVEWGMVSEHIQRNTQLNKSQ